MFSLYGDLAPRPELLFPFLILVLVVPVDLIIPFVVSLPLPSIRLAPHPLPSWTQRSDLAVDQPSVKTPRGHSRCMPR